MSITIYHNPNCSTSRKALAILRDQGLNPTVVEYLKTGWTVTQLQSILKKAGLSARDILRVKGTPAAELGLTDPGIGDAAILQAMTEHPILVERPIVETETEAVLCRPVERLLTLVNHK